MTLCASLTRAAKTISITKTILFLWTSPKPSRKKYCLSRLSPNAPPHIDSLIAKAAFGVTPSEYMETKGLKRENLRDHMDDLELIFTMLGERATTEIHRNEDSKGVPKLKKDSRAGGKIAGDARKALEKRLKRPVVSRHNYLKTKESQKELS